MIEYRVNEPEIDVEYMQRVGAYGIVVNEEQKIGIVKTSTGYFLPGGGLEKCETIHECLRREFIEEVGMDIEIVNQFAVISYFFYSTTLNTHMESKGYFFKCKYKNIISENNEEDHELVWLTSEEAIEKLFLENQKNAIKEFIEL